MGLDFPASASALWTLYDKTGVRPEWLLPVLANESGLNPAISNQAGYPYYGLNQIGGSQLSAMGITVADYLTWPASRQISTVVEPYMASAIAHYGPLRSGIRVYQANFYPASLAYAKGLDDTIVAAPTAAYEANTGLDFGHDGRISPRDLGIVVGQQAAKPYVRSAISQTYAARPFEIETDPVMGQDFGGALVASLLDPRILTNRSVWLGLGIVGVAWWAAGRIRGS